MGVRVFVNELLRLIIKLIIFGLLAAGVYWLFVEGRNFISTGKEHSLNMFHSSDKAMQNTQELQEEQFKP
jgi:hypothetical protein